MRAGGPDGVGPNFYKLAPVWIHKLLYRGYCAIFSSPKSIRDEDATCVARSADDIRGIALANADVKLYSSAMNAPLAGYVRSNLHEAQAAVPGGVLVDNVLAVDTIARTVATLRDSYPFLICFDYKNAFPPVATYFIFLVMRVLKFPSVVRHAFRLFLRTSMWCCAITVASLTSAWRKEALCRVRPLNSSNIFNICLDVIVRALHNAMGPHDTVRGHMDDLAIVVANIFNNMPLVLSLFEEFAMFAGLQLKLSKCVAVSLSHGDTSAVVELVKRQLPKLATFIFAGAT